MLSVARGCAARVLLILLRLSVLLPLLPLLVALQGCALARLQEDSDAFYRSTVLVGRVTAPAGWQGPVRVAAVRDDGDSEGRGGHELAHHVWLHEPGGFELIVPDGRYTLLAFADANGNGHPDTTEPAARLAQPLDVNGQGIVMQMDMVLQPGAAETVRRIWPGLAAGAAPRHSTQAGAPLEFDAPAFSAAQGAEGYWAPLQAFRNTGGNVYFVEPYDARRTPVLLLHGAAGSAQDWRPLVAGLDRSRYQAWIFQYPSGAPLDSMAHLLYWKLLNLQVRHRFQRLHIVAHSAGGLVARRLLLDHGAEFRPQLGSFVTLSTPWGGERFAAVGVKHSPAVVPSWRDMQPEGLFLKTLFERPLAAGLRHVLLFGHRGGYSLLRPTSDGTITLASQLQPQAQAGAALVMGFDEDHVSILAAPQVIHHVQRQLAAADEPAAAGGQIDVQVDGAAVPAGQLPFLVLMPLDANGRAAGSPLQFPAVAPGGTVTLGAVPPGRYEAALSLAGFRAQPGRQPVQVAAGGQLALRFELQASGQIGSYVAAEADVLSRPAGSLRLPHADVVIRRIALQGPGGLQRTLQPRSDGPPDLLQAYLDGRDDAVGAMFLFSGLAAGDYVLRIEADGHLPHVSHYHVVPGQATPVSPVLLRRVGTGAAMR